MCGVWMTAVASMAVVTPSPPRPRAPATPVRATAGWRVWVELSTRATSRLTEGVIRSSTGPGRRPAPR